MIGTTGKPSQARQGGGAGGRGREAAEGGGCRLERDKWRELIGATGKPSQARQGGGGKGKGSGQGGGGCRRGKDGSRALAVATGEPKPVRYGQEEVSVCSFQVLDDMAGMVEGACKNAAHSCKGRERPWQGSAQLFTQQAGKAMAHSSSYHHWLQHPAAGTVAAANCPLCLVYLSLRLTYACELVLGYQRWCCQGLCCCCCCFFSWC